MRSRILSPFQLSVSQGKPTNNELHLPAARPGRDDHHLLEVRPGLSMHSLACQRRAGKGCKPRGTRP